MPLLRLALANLRYPTTLDESVQLAEEAIAAAGAASAALVCFPECYVPGYRAPDKALPPPDAALLERAWEAVAESAARHRVGVVLGTERLVEGALYATALVIGPDGARLGFQDKVQLDPSEEGTYTPGTTRQLFHIAPLTFGVAICHEGWRYPETVRWAARLGAQVVFHPHFHDADPDRAVPFSRFADPDNSFHEKALLCRAAENTCYIAAANCAAATAATTSAFIRPDGTLLAWQPYGLHGVLVAELELDAATGLLARRVRALPPPG